MTLVPSGAGAPSAPNTVATMSSEASPSASISGDAPTFGAMLMSQKTMVLPSLPPGDNTNLTVSFADAVPLYLPVIVAVPSCVLEISTCAFPWLPATVMSSVFWPPVRAPMSVSTEIRALGRRRRAVLGRESQ